MAQIMVRLLITRYWQFLSYLLTHCPVFSKPFFRGWIVVVFFWAFFASIAITCYPIWEGRVSIVRFIRYAIGQNLVIGQREGIIEGINVGLRRDYEAAAGEKV